MGEWFAAFLKKNGYEVIISDKNKPAAKSLARKKGFRFLEDQTRAVRLAQLVILATPTQVTARLLEQIGPRLSPGTLLVEISSVKEPVRRTIQKLQRQGVAVLSIHPMFGPGAKTLTNKTVITVTIPQRNILARMLLSLLKKRRARIVRSNFDEHDKLASVLLALPHFLNIAMVNTLRSMGANPNRLREIAGTTFNLHFLVAQAIYQEDLSNEASILMDSEHTLNLLRKFAHQSTATLKLIEKGKRNGIVRNLCGGRDFLQKDRLFANAYERFNVAVEASSLG